MAEEPDDEAPATGGDPSFEADRPRWWRSGLFGWIPRALRGGLAMFIFFLVVEYIVVPAFLRSRARSSLSQLGRVNAFWLIGGVVLEAAALFAYGCLTKAVLPKDSPSYSKVLRIDLSTLAVSHVIPAGTAGGTGLGYMLLTSNGVSGTDAGFAIATQGIGSAIVLNVMLWLALIISIPLHGLNQAYVTVALVGAVLLLLFGVLVLGLTRGERHAKRALRAIARYIPRVSEDEAEDLVIKLGIRIRSLAEEPHQLRRAVSWAASNWFFDATALWAFVCAYQAHVISPIDLFVAYGLANLVAAIPLTPGGLGVVEAVAATTLIGFGVNADVAWLGVITWRLFNFWVPIPVGAGAYLSLRVRRGAGLRERRTVLEGMTAPTARFPPAPGAAPERPTSRFSRVLLPRSEDPAARQARSAPPRG
jgi:uncharacterized protein (TIRG00374 family)